MTESETDMSTAPEAPALMLGAPDLELFYEALSAAIEEVGPSKSGLLLVKLALLNAEALGDPALCIDQLGRALQDL